MNLLETDWGLQVDKAQEVTAYEMVLSAVKRTKVN